MSKVYKKYCKYCDKVLTSNDFYPKSAKCKQCYIASQRCKIVCTHNKKYCGYCDRVLEKDKFYNRAARCRGCYIKNIISRREEKKLRTKIEAEKLKLIEQQKKVDELESQLNKIITETPIIKEII